MDPAASPRRRKRHRLVGTFRTDEEAARAARAARRADVEAEEVVVDDPEDEVIALRGEQRDEVDEMLVGPAGVSTGGQLKGWLLGIVAGGAIGGIVATPFGLIPFLGLDLIPRLAIAFVAGAFAGGTIGFLVGGSFWPGREGETEPPAPEDGTTVAVHTEDEAKLERAYEELKDSAAERVDREDTEGAVLPPDLRRTGPVSTREDVAKRGLRRPDRSEG